ncbi:MAG TPA: beta-propeller fold lactonase family protein [Propionibacteriaceae bacterium]|nr:beta-propeller fold lactonase family protein [Propionibacteriaceae bacterium]
MSSPVLALVTNAQDGTVSTFRIADERLQRLAVSPVGAGCSTLAIDAERHLVYVGTKPGSVVTCSLDPETGRLTVRGETRATGSPTYLTLTPHGDRLLGAFYHEGVGTCWPLDDGRLGEASPAVSHANLHSVVVTKDTRHAYFVSLGEDAVVRYELAQDGSLTHGASFAAPSGSGPRHIVLDATETAAYVVTEFSGELLRYARDTASGDLTLTAQQSVVDPSAGLAHSRYGADPTAEHLIWGADVHLSPDGHWAWASERSASTIATLPLGLSGEPGPATQFTPTEAQPRGFGVAPDGTHLLAVGERSTTATLYAVGADGGLTVLDRQETGKGANWVRFV